MKTKTRNKIYEEQTLLHLGNNPNGTRMDIVESSMEEYATQQAIQFGWWISEVCSESDDKGKFCQEGVYYHCGLKKMMTITELYELFNANG